jgi:putative glutamine amidotransferase
VCRGAQVLNVALGGTLHQHLPEVTGVEHRGGSGVYTPTDVRLAAGSRLAGLLGECTQVCCYHHQGLDRLGEGLIAVGVAPDGAIEAVELPGGHWVVGVQWHPEEGSDLQLFAALVEQARRRHG